MYTFDLKLKINHKKRVLSSIDSTPVLALKLDISFIYLTSFLSPILLILILKAAKSKVIIGLNILKKQKGK